MDIKPVERYRNHRKPCFKVFCRYMAERYNSTMEIGQKYLKIGDFDGFMIATREYWKRKGIDGEQLLQTEEKNRQRSKKG